MTILASKGLVFSAVIGMTTFCLLTAAPISKEVVICDSPECRDIAMRMSMAMNRSVDPCFDFYEYACGGFRTREQIPSGQFVVSSFSKVHSMVQNKVREILESPPPQECEEPLSRQKMRLLYASCMDQKTINENGIRNLKEMTEAMGGLLLTPLDGNASKLPADWSLEKLLEKRNTYAISSFFKIAVGPDDKDARKNAIQMDQGGLGLGERSRDFYVNSSITLDPLLRTYALYLESISKLIVGTENVNMSCILDVVEFEQRLAWIQDPVDQKRDILSLYSKVNVTWLNENAPALNWTSFFASFFKPVGVEINDTEPIIMYSSKYFKALSLLLEEYLSSDIGKQVLQNYVILDAVSTYAPKFGDQFKSAYSDFASVFLGRLGDTEQWQDCVDSFNSPIGFSLSAMFLERFFHPKAKMAAEEIVRAMTPAFRHRMSKADWMVDVDRETALGKLDAMTFNIGFPDWLFNDTVLDEIYANMSITDDYTRNQLSISRFLQHKMLKDIRRPVDSSRWRLAPHSADAYYEASHNRFIIPAGMLTEPFFYGYDGVPMALNFGSLGAIVGHEITHSSDDIGRQFDANGSLNNWWQEDTLRAFTERTNCLVDQYDRILIDDLNVRGLQTLGENIADNGGLKTAFLAYRKSSADRECERGFKNMQLAGLDATEDELFFLAYAQMWCSVKPAVAVRTGILMDDHSPDSVRINGPVSNSFEFAEAFQCKQGTQMNPAKKCAVW